MELLTGIFIQALICMSSKIFHISLKADCISKL